MDRCPHISLLLYVQRSFPGPEGQPEAELNPVKPELNVIIANHYSVPLSAAHEGSTLQTWFSAPLPRLEPVSYYVCCSTEQSKGIGNIWRYLSFDRNVNSKKVEGLVLERMYAGMTFRSLCNKD
ncbi:hypothetical protein ALC56_03659 [Trachymyrmex septentrionalis]|uniref:Uncharacterized protein n=1 Tax=Trachymyrmex septentrionalis TaxID=34720 RepID=A0A151JZE8_9HYME|nr:hypothetical protein ALC56_03659 [Trachymyrmex septentrionalis]